MTYGDLVGMTYDGACYCPDCGPPVTGAAGVAEALARAEDQGRGGALLAGFEYDALVAIRDPRTYFSDPDDLTDFFGDGFTHLGVVPPPTCSRCGRVIPGGQPLPVCDGAYVDDYAVYDERGASLIIRW